MTHLGLFLFLDLVTCKKCYNVFFLQLYEDDKEWNDGAIVTNMITKLLNQFPFSAFSTNDLGKDKNSFLPDLPHDWKLLQNVLLLACHNRKKENRRVTTLEKNHFPFF